ncbi:aldehyde dehydrogenase family protein [Rhizobium lusitanum]|uniref:aldehyde dehydrogenase (NAD(+)) n=1 Tax=Rhizobium lusitanum TaxID=293958 RepID=A0A6L9UBU6_9HYPH|nr:aldehyde dehydrogenase family protein [Rhizobium lusitanum]NEI71610.1 aldehyde dehydrogenase family protein [Rhizobium lusitanum]
MIDTRKFYIDGQWVAPKGGEVFDVVNPATLQPVATISLASVEDVDAAVAAARRAFATYSLTPLSERLTLLERLQAIYRRRYREMAETITLELGAPATMSYEQQADVGTGHLQAFMDALREHRPVEVLPNGETVLREPIGVCGLITPWNWPVNQIALKVIPALATGCTCILKPSEFTPLSALLYAEMIDEAGFPAGVFNLVNGNGAVAGAALSKHPDVDMMSFTGSTRAGIAVSRDAAETVKRVSLELGGKSPNLIFEDADIEAAVRRGVQHCFNNSGQSCNAPTRMLVQRSVYERAIIAAEAAGREAQVGDPVQQGPHIGPVVNAQQWERIQTLIRAGIDEGARLLVGGPGKPEGFASGHFVRPTVFADVRPDMRVFRDEIFGPVLSITPFDTEEDAIALANDTPYGLAAYVQSGDEARIGRVIPRLRAGMIHVNGAGRRYGSPFGGYKQSGNGREGGKFGLEDFLEVKSIHRG